MKRRLRGPAAVAISALVAAGASGCAVFSPVQTAQSYEPADGFSTTVGPVKVLNALVVSEGEGAPGVLSATLSNSTPEAVELTISAEGAEDTTVTVPSGQLIKLGDESVRQDNARGSATAPVAESFQVPSVDVTPGEVLPLTFAAAGATVELPAPVLLPRLEYADITPSSTPTGSVTGTPTSSPTSSGNATSDTDPEPLENDAEPTTTDTPGS